MSQVGFETAIPVFERAKTVHALQCAATVICKVHAGSCNGLVKSSTRHYNPKILGSRGNLESWHWLLAAGYSVLRCDSEC
jgi:hypothetical protein